MELRIAISPGNAEGSVTFNDVYVNGSISGGGATGRQYVHLMNQTKDGRGQSCAVGDGRYAPPRILVAEFKACIGTDRGTCDLKIECVDTRMVGPGTKTLDHFARQ